MTQVADFSEQVVLVDPRLLSDVKSLALAVLRGDDSAVRPMIDCWLENTTGRERITPAYVQALEDRLMDWRREFEVGRATAVHVETVAGYRQADLPRLRREWVGLERTARQLGRQGLS